MAKEIEIGLCFDELIVMKNGKEIERIKITLDDVLKESGNELTEVDNQILEKYGKDNVVFGWEKRGVRWSANIEVNNYVRYCLDDKKEGVKKESLNLLNKMLKQSMSNDRIAILLHDAISNYEKIINEHTIRIKELAVFLYPGLYEESKDNITFIKRITRGEVRSAIMDKIIEDKSYENIVKSLAQNVLDLNTIKEEMEERLREIIEQIMPTTYELIGYKLTAKLLSEAGSLERLAKLPSSTIQVMGAEKALFLHLLGKSKSPKHGIIFLSEYIQSVPKKQRGKVARVLALKISKAVRMDFYGKGSKEEGRKLKDEMNRFLEKVVR